MVTSIKLALGLVDEVIEYLEDTLQAHLSAEETLWADDIQLPMVNAFLRRDTADPRRMNNPPYLYSVVTRSTVQDWGAGQALAMHQMHIWLVTLDHDPEQLRLKVYRYGNAIWKALAAADTALSYRMATLEVAPMPEIDYSETLTSGSVSYADVRVTSWWTKLESD